MNENLIFDEKLDISFEAIGYYGKQREPFVFKAHIIYKQNELVLLVITSEQGDIAEQKLFEALRSPIKKKDYKITKAYFGDKSIKLEKHFDIKFTICTQSAFMLMPLNQIRFTYKDEENERIYRLTSVCSPIIFSPTELLIYKNGTAGFRNSTLSKQCCGIPFTLFKEDNYAYIKTDEIDKLLKIFSFYYCTRFEYDMVSSPEQDGNVSILIKKPQYKTTSGNSLKTIGYLFSGQNSLATFGGFLSATNDCTNEIWNDKFLSDYISGFVRAEYLDDISKLTIYTTILEKMAGAGKKEDTYKCIKHYLAQNKIDIRKIDDNVSSKNIKNENGDTISNFIQLRNFFVHHLGSEKAEKFLRDSDMLFYLKLTITILILYRLGLTNIRFKSYFAHLSVFNECLKVG